MTGRVAQVPCTAFGGKRKARFRHDIAVYRDGERAERGEINLEEAATLLQVSSVAG